jgi:hypothetical protein
VSVKKALALLALLAILGFAALVLINTFRPNPYTATIYTFITVTVPAYLSDKLEWVLGSAGAVITVVGAASKKIGNVKDEASSKIMQAEEAKNQAQTKSGDMLGELQKKDDKIMVLEKQVEDMEKNKSAAEKTVEEQAQLITTLKREKQEYKELAEKKIGGTVEVYK